MIFSCSTPVSTHLPGLWGVDISGHLFQILSFGLNDTFSLKPNACYFKTKIVYILVRDGDTVKHYRIRQLDEGGFFIARRVTFRTLAELVEHYSRDADGLCVNLRKPCSQV